MLPRMCPLDSYSWDSIQASTSRRSWPRVAYLPLEQRGGHRADPRAGPHRFQDILSRERVIGEGQERRQHQHPPAAVTPRPGIPSP